MNYAQFALAIVLIACAPTPTGDGYMLASAETRSELCMDDSTREQVRKLMFDALDQAFKDHIIHLYDVMMKAGGDLQRAGVGTRQGLRAYLIGREALLKWAPPECSG